MGESSPEPVHVPPPPLAVSDVELKAMDDSILHMAKIGRRRGVTSTSLSLMRDNSELCQKTDELIAETLISLKRNVPVDAAEKLFERISKVLDGWPDKDEQTTLGVVFIRYMDTMTYFVAYKRKFRGIDRESSISKVDALGELKARGLTKR